MQRRQQQQGFTLIEILVALAVMALVAVMAWRGVSALSDTRVHSEARLQRIEQLQTLMLQWETDLREVQDSGLVNALAFDGRALRLTRRREAGLQLVAWQLHEGRLVRWESAPATSRSALQEAWWRSQQLGSDELAALPGVAGVAGWQMYFFRGNAWSNAQSSDDVSSAEGAASAPVTGTRRVVPGGVRMSLQFQQPGGYNGTLLREVMVEASNP